MANRLSVHLGLVAGLTAIVIGLSGCGTGDSTTTETTQGDASLSPPAVQTAGTLKVCAANNGTPPNIYIDESGTLVGSEVDLAKALAQQLGLKADFVESDFSALIPTLQAKQCDVIMSTLYIKPEREEVVDFVPYLYSGTGIAVSSEHESTITGMNETLCGKTALVAVGTTAESLTEEQAEKCASQGLPELTITKNSHADVAIQQLQNQQIDAYVDTAETIGYYATKTGAKIELAGKPFGAIQVGAATLKNNTDLHDALEDAFETTVDDGTYDSILEEWGQTSLSINESSNEG